MLATIDQWATRINQQYGQTVKSLFEVGQSLIEAKANLGHGRFTKMINDDLVFSPRTAQRLMLIARGPLKTANLAFLPSSTTVLEQLSQLSGEQVTELERTGSLSADMELKDARKLLKACGVRAPEKAPPSEPVSEGFEPVGSPGNPYPIGEAERVMQPGPSIQEQVAAQPEPGSVIEPDLPPLSSGLKEMAGLAAFAEDVTMTSQDRLDLIGKIDEIWETKVSPAMTALQKDLEKELD